MASTTPSRLQVQGMKIGQSCLSKLICGKRPVSDNEVVALSEALKVTIEWLLGKE